MCHSPIVLYSVVAPDIYWSQNSFVVRLAVKVKEVRGPSTNIVTFNDNSVHFR